MDLAIRDAGSADAEAIARIYVESWNQGFGPLMPPRILDAAQIGRWHNDLGEGSVNWRVAVQHEVIVGFAGTGPSRDPVDPTLGELDTIAVEPGHWRTGIGRRLMADALEQMTQDGYRSAILWTLADYAQARNFYQDSGWRADGSTRDDGRQVAFRHPLGLRQHSSPSF